MKTLADILPELLTKLKDDFPTIDQIREKLPEPYISVSADERIKYWLDKLYNHPTVGKKAFRAANITTIDKAVLFAIKEGKKGRALKKRMRELLIQFSPTASFSFNFDARIQKLIKLAEEDAEIKDILIKAGYIKQP